jgi:hypothetical protein
MSIWSTLAKIGGAVAAPFTGGASLALPALFEAGGAALGGASQASASNRGAQIEAAIEQERLRQQQEKNYREALVQREQEGRASATDAFRKLQQTSYLMNRADYTPTSVTSQGKPLRLASFGFGPKSATESEITGADALRTEVLKRLTQGNAIPEVQAPSPFTIDPKLLKGSIWEKLAGIAGPALSLYGAATNPNRNSN